MGNNIQGATYRKPMYMIIQLNKIEATNTWDCTPCKNIRPGLGLGLGLVLKVSILGEILERVNINILDKICYAGEDTNIFR